jgi:hypothetical protein
LRALTKLERQVANDPDTTADLSTPQQTAVGRYLDALRAVLLTKAQARFDWLSAMYEL